MGAEIKAATVPSVVQTRLGPGQLQHTTVGRATVCSLQVGLVGKGPAMVKSGIGAEGSKKTTIHLLGAAGFDEPDEPVEPPQEGWRGCQDVGGSSRPVMTWR